MSRSEPKPKIIYRKLEDIINKSNSQNKKKSEPTNGPTISKTQTIRSKTQSNRPSLSKNSSKHSLKSKEKIFYLETQKQYSFSNEMKNKQKKINEESLITQIDSLYFEMEKFLHSSKEDFLKEIKSTANPHLVQKKVKQLQKMSDYLRHIISLFIGQKTISPTKFDAIDSKVLKDSTKENKSIEALSKMNQKKKINSRFKQIDSNKRPTLYEHIINKLS